MSEQLIADARDMYRRGDGQKSVPDLCDALEAAEKRVAELTAERDQLRARIRGLCQGLEPMAEVMAQATADDPELRELFEKIRETAAKGRETL